MRPFLYAAAAILAAGLAAAGPAAASGTIADQVELAPGSADIGRAIAMRWCAGCHQVRGSQQSGGNVAPSFLEIAKKGQGLDWLDGFLAAPHPPMPDMSLSRQEILDLRAYIEFLRD